MKALSVLGSGLFLLVAATACGGAQHGFAGAATVRADVTKVLDAQYAALGAADAEACTTFMADDVVVFGTDPAESLVGRAQFAQEMGADLGRVRAAGLRGTFQVANREIGVADDGLAVWVNEDVQLVIMEGEDVKVRVPATVVAMLVNGDNGWQLVAWHWAASEGQPAEGEPREIADQRAPGSEALLAAAEAAVQKEGFGAFRGGVRVGLAPGGKSGWVAGVSDTKRALTILTMRNNAWEAVATKVSAGVADMPEKEEEPPIAPDDPANPCGPANPCAPTPPTDEQLPQ